MTASRLTTEILPRLEAARARAIEEAEVCAKNDYPSLASHSYGQATAFATCIEWLESVTK